MASWWNNFIQKLNPAQPEIAMEEGKQQSSTQTKLSSVTKAYEIIEVVNRCVNLLVDNAAMVDYDIKSKLRFTGQVSAVSSGLKDVTLDKLLNYRPNPFMDISTFRRLILTDFLIDGNSFIHFDGNNLFHIPAKNMEIITDERGYVSGYKYGAKTTFNSNEIIHIKDNSVETIYRGYSRINSALESLYSRETMLNFQKSFFDNGAAVGLVIETDEILSRPMKERQERDWMQKYNPSNGSGRPLILDNGAKAKTVANSNFRELSFNDSIDNKEDKVCVALGVPPLLIDSGNNANIKPNIELMFYTTIIPMLRKFESAIENYFAFDVELSTHRVPALLPDKKAETERLSALVNNGIITGNEARLILRMEEIDEKVMQTIRIPANIAGSGTGVEGQEGGRPQNED